MSESSLLDFVIRKQNVIFWIIGLLAGIVAAVIYARKTHLLETSGETLGELAFSVLGSGLGGGAILSHAMATGSKKSSLHLAWTLRKPLITIAVLALGGTALGAWVGNRKPIPKTANLDTPGMELDLRKPNLLIFVHGWRGDSDGTWQRFPDLIRKDHRFDDTHVVAIDYPTLVARRNLTIGETATYVAEKLEAGNVGHYAKIAIIAHSIGGLVSRKLVLQRRTPFKSLGVVVEVGTPHLGTERYAQLLSDLGIPGGDLTEEVKVGSSWLRELRNDWNAMEARPVSQCFTSPNDGLVPQDSALFQCDKFHYLPGFDHTAMVKPESQGDDRYSGPAREVDSFLHPQTIPPATDGGDAKKPAKPASPSGKRKAQSSGDRNPRDN